MSKELNFADGYDEVKYLDNSTNFDLILTENNIAFDLSRADAIAVKIGNDDGYIMEKDIDPKTITNYQSGEIIFPVDDSIMSVLVPDDYYIEIWMKVNPVSVETDSESATFTVDNDSLEERQSIFPSTGLLGFTIDDNINSTTGEVIPTITFDQLQSQFNDMMAQMDNVVHNVQKGDKGDTGNGVSSTTIQYQISNNSTVTPTGTWSNNIITPTQDNPYLWLQATLNYTDGTSKTFYLISEKGDKGDQGIQGIQGEKGDTGAGLQVKGKVNDVSQLPATGQDGYCYFVGIDMYVWTNNQWNNMGDISPDLSNYVTLTDMNNGLATKVTDNKDGTEQLNGVQIQPFNKLTDTVGTRNYIATNSWIALGQYGYYTAANGSLKHGNGSTVDLYSDYISISPQTMLFTWYSSPTGGRAKVHAYDVTKTWIKSFNISNAVGSTEIDLPSNTEFITINVPNPNTYGGQSKLTVGEVKTDWVPAPEDKADDSKVVHTADMRKPASDVVGLEDVPQAVVRTYLTNGTDLHNITTPGIYPFNGCTFINDMNSDTKWGFLIVTNVGNQVVLQQMVQGNGQKYGQHIYNGGSDSWSDWVTPADDSKVAHLSGANNFDTVPTVNNNAVVTKDQLTNVIVQQIDPNADLFAIKQAGVYKSVWGNQDTLKNFPSPDGSATIIYSGSGSTDNGIKITVLDSWGSIFVSTWQGAASTPTYSPWKNVTDVATTNDVTTASNTVLTSANTSISKLLQSSSSNDEDSAVTNSTSDTNNFYYWTE